MHFLKRLALALSLAFFTASFAAPVTALARSVASAARPFFAAEAAAQAHCPRDEVVWLNIPSSIYHEKGMRWYGRTKNGAFVCRKEADTAGDRDTRNGQ